MKLFVSQPMSDRTNEQIKEEREYLIELAKKVLNTEDIEVIDSFFEGAPHNANPLWFLSKSIELLSTADVAIFSKDWDNYRGCRAEEQICSLYNIDTIIDNKYNVYHKYHNKEEK